MMVTVIKISFKDQNQISQIFVKLQRLFYFSYFTVIIQRTITRRYGDTLCNSYHGRVIHSKNIYEVPTMYHCAVA